MNSALSSPQSTRAGSMSPFIHSPLPLRKASPMIKKAQAPKLPIFDFGDAEDSDFDIPKPSKFLIQKLQQITGECPDEDDFETSTNNTSNRNVDLCDERRCIVEASCMDQGFERPISRAVNPQIFDQQFEQKI